MYHLSSFPFVLCSLHQHIHCTQRVGDVLMIGQIGIHTNFLFVRPVLISWRRGGKRNLGEEAIILFADITGFNHLVQLETSRSPSL